MFRALTFGHGHLWLVTISKRFLRKVTEIFLHSILVYAVYLEKTRSSGIKLLNPVLLTCRQNFALTRSKSYPVSFALAESCDYYSIAVLQKLAGDTAVF
ncbi:hypothetical protein PsorP6_011580 [Peronosclerospora sorghi]|uniref:Uncharacterized protein n=1 Tax=Peronosclerospora sorghi TaxID=230839 RepID=A0ACC0WK15_9STRA|nr:hypothetical protein PsorP6_011580 [Peronosclerospora sorghi]